MKQDVYKRQDKDRKPIPGTEKEIECDTVLLSVGLIPENELSKNAGVEMDMRTKGPIVYENMETSIPGIFACGNVCLLYTSMNGAAAFLFAFPRRVT